MLLHHPHDETQLQHMPTRENPPVCGVWVVCRWAVRVEGALVELTHVQHMYITAKNMYMNSTHTRL